MQIIFPFFDVLKLLIVGILEHFSTEGVQSVHCQICTKKSAATKPLPLSKGGVGEGM